LKEGSNPKAETVLYQYYRVFLVAIGVGVAAILLFPIQASSLAQYFSVLTTGVLFAGAFLALGSLAGFLFGIPYANQQQNTGQQVEGETAVMAEPTRQADERNLRLYRPNTNLEQISDWLTKILVGVGLVQLTQVPDAPRSAVTTPALGTWSVDPFGVAILIHFGRWGSCSCSCGHG
jgi:hypothetical protein